ncbi:MAG TPA: DUF4097 family beta strand repeat-containing protein [Terriglobales bacterium]|jgi:DUF4097 and DUF4098 domain-containing protein YvlB|nr:DUF4097 family beta strand repeat-containing protein [Terriglobales bacterium]
MSSPAPVVTPPRRHRSFAGPVVLIIIGLVFLLGNMHVITWHALGLWFARYWPVLIIIWGVVKLMEYYQAQREGTRAPGLGVGGFFLLLFLICCGLAASKAARVNWHAVGDEMDMGDNMWPVFGDTYSFNDQMQQAFPAGASLRVVSNRGGVTVNSWDQKDIKVVVHKRLVADNEQQSKQVDSQTRPTISVSGNLVTVNANTTGAGDQHAVSTDLDITVPRTVAVDVATQHGDISVQGRDAEVKVSNSHGDVNLGQITGNSSVVMRKGSLTAAHLKGDLSVDGRLDDTNISDVSGKLEMTGDYFGDMTLAGIKKGVRFKSSRTDMEFSRLDGDLSMESGDLQAKSLAGPLRLLTRSKDIHLDNVTGDVKVENSNGSVELHAGKLPLGSMQIDNSKGDIQVVLPTEATFSLSARTRDGDIESDFNQIQVNSDHGQSTASGKVGSGASRLEINNQYGSIEIRKGGATEASNQD